MTRATLAMVAILLVVGSAPAQDVQRVFSRPTLPPREALDRLNLKVAWRTYVPTDGKRDGLKSIQLLGPDILVLTRSGIVTMLDASTGQARWKASTGRAYPVVSGATTNSRVVITINATLLTAFDRANGRVLWEWEIPGSSISAPPLADDGEIEKKQPPQLYVFKSSNMMEVYQLPLSFAPPKPEEGKPEPSKEPKEPPKEPKPPVKPEQPVIPQLGGKKVETPEIDKGVMAQMPSYYGGTGAPLSSIGALSGARQASRMLKDNMRDYFLFEYLCPSRLDEAPVMNRDGLLFAGQNGLVFTVSKSVGKEFFPALDTGGVILTPPAIHGDTTYVVGGDNILYAVKMLTGRRFWRFTKGAPILHRPAATDDSVFVTVDRTGLWRLDRETGAEVWENREADRFLSANEKFVYALDRIGRLMVLDRKRGTKLSGYDTRDFIVPIINDETDRFYLAANDGMIACLHDKDHVRPLPMKTPGGLGPLPGNGKPGEKPKEDGEKPKEKPKEGDGVGVGEKPKDKEP